MESKILENKNETKDEIFKQNKIYDLKGRKIEVKKIIKEYLSSEIKNVESLNRAMSLDDTVPEIYYQKLLIKQEAKLKERSYDLLDKEQIKKFNVNKINNFKEIYFYIINYIESVNLDEDKNSDLGFDKEEFEKKGQEEEEDTEEQEEQEKQIDGEEQELQEKKQDNFKNKNESIKIKDKDINDIIIKVNIKEKNDLDEDVSDKKFNEILKNKEKFNIEELLIKEETIKVKDIKNKFNIVYDKFFSFSNFRNNYPDFESEYFYYNSLRYMLETFKILKKKKFIKKIFITYMIKNFSYKIKMGKIKDKLLKVFYYYIINTQYDFDEKLLLLLDKYDENELDILKSNKNYFINNNCLFSKKSNQIIIENIDHYSINEIVNFLEKNKKEKLLWTSFSKIYYSIKGILMNSSFKKEGGDKFWNEFLESPILDDIVYKLYKKENIFKKKLVINLFKEFSYYFPNFNSSFVALSHKDLFNMYFPPIQIITLEKALENTYAIEMVNKAFNKISIQHEWGHISSSFYFFISKTKYFETPERKFKVKDKKKSKEKEKIIKEGGKAVEYLIYGRIMREMNAKEAIFILNWKNFKLLLKDFRFQFSQLKYRKLSDVFEEAISIENIDETVKNAYNEYKAKGSSFQYNLEYYSFRAKRKEKIYLNLENLKFKIHSKHHFRHSDFINKNKKK